MTTSSLSSIYSNIEPTLSSALQSINSPTTAGSSTSGIGGQSDSSKLSPLAKLLSQLQQLQQSNPAEYAQVTQQIASSLQSAAQSATSSGNTTGAAQLTQLATDFTNASTSGRLPNIQDLATAIGGGSNSSGANSIYHTIESTLTSALQGVSSATSTAATSGVGAQSDSSSLSPLAQILSQLQQLQQSDPSKYAQVTQQISTNLEKAAQADTASGNTAGAAQLTQLAKDFTTASTSGQLPDVQDLASAIGKGGHHHGGHGHSADSDSSSTASSTSTSTDATTQALQQLLAAFQSTGTQSSSQNPLAIIMNTLSSAGVTSNN